MNEKKINYIPVPSLSKKEFNILGTFIHKRFGIKMPDSKRVMVESRLRKRLQNFDFSSYSQYCDYLFSPDGMEKELRHFIDLITTNKTDFFREPKHFKYLVENALPQLMETCGAGVKKTLNVWSSACSQGDEPYTLSMVLSEFAKNYEYYDFSILATDVSLKMIELGQKGIYPHPHIESVSLDLRKKYLMRSIDKKKDLVRIVPELRKKIIFRRLNLIKGDFPFRQTMDIIFCRNVIIYFDRETSYELLERLCGKLRKGGFLFMGHSELLDCKMLPLVQTSPTIYQKI